MKNRNNDTYGLCKAKRESDWVGFAPTYSKFPNIVFFYFIVSELRFFFGCFCPIFVSFSAATLASPLVFGIGLTIFELHANVFRRYAASHVFCIQSSVVGFNHLFFSDLLYHADSVSKASAVFCAVPRTTPAHDLLTLRPLCHMLNCSLV